ncbi:SDR family oxidoreductase [Leptospirillum ferrooxidans]|uniref:dTDP-4-dehydrorhamnose reductase n=1 Tax=Leptospirillum ferrooxidans (strain C2-3) TaxID=1162668 RepID=I0IP26_LEPFC|nr:NAD(P)-dependent oxidoreductase [Leptospirillum ferrooxidans]BAM07025.1 putative WbbW [Leptospirillum ferrooxidans C2-3]
MSNLLITGSTGMLGSYISRNLSLSNFNLVIPPRNELDLDNPQTCYETILKYRPYCIIHMAAETDVDLCERAPQIAARKNALATQSIAQGARECGSYLVYISTSNIFSSANQIIFNELDIPNPSNYYGKSKFYGEQAIAMFGPKDFLIIRAGWMIGGGRGKDHKFVGKIIEAIESGVPEIKAVSDRIGSITEAESLSCFIKWAIDNRPAGIVHYASIGGISRYEIALELSKILKYRGKVTSVSSSMFPLSAPRPLSDAIESIYLPLMTSAPFPGMWREDLERYVMNF